jgi:hypothetical protein
MGKELISPVRVISIEEQLDRAFELQTALVEEHRNCLVDPGYDDTAEEKDKGEGKNDFEKKHGQKFNTIMRRPA